MSKSLGDIALPPWESLSPGNIRFPVFCVSQAALSILARRSNSMPVDSLIAPYSRIVSNTVKPRGRRFILRERSYVEI